MTHGWYAKHRVEQLKPSVKRMRGSNDGAAESFLTWPAAVGCGIWGNQSRDYYCQVAHNYFTIL